MIISGREAGAAYAELRARSAGRRQGARGAPRRGSVSNPGAAFAALVTALGGNWFDGADVAHITLNAGNVQSWSPRAGSGAALTQVTAGKQPAWAANVVTWAAASSQVLVGANASTYLSTTGWSALIAANPTSIANNNIPTSYFLNDVILCDDTACDTAMALRSTGALQTGGTSGAGSRAAEQSGVTTGAWQLLEGSWDNATLRARVGAGATATQALAGPLSSIASPFNLGARNLGAKFYNGSMKGVALFPTYLLGDSRWPTVRSLFGAIYGVAA